MTATVLPLKEARTTESGTPEGSRHCGIRIYLLEVFQNSEETETESDSGVWSRIIF